MKITKRITRRIKTMIGKRLQSLINKEDLFLFTTNTRYYIEGNKSRYNRGIYPVFCILQSSLNNVLIVYQNDNANKQSIYNDIVKIIHDLDMEKCFSFSTNPLKITYKLTGQVIYFCDVDNICAITEIATTTGFLNRIVIEEASKLLLDYETFNILDKSLMQPKFDAKKYKLEDYEDAYVQIFCVLDMEE